MLTGTPAPRAIGVNLVLFFAFALSALVFLAHTLVSIRQTQAGVAHAVRPAVSGIEADTALLPALMRTRQLTGGLASASQGINDSLTAAVTYTRDINTRLATVRTDSGAIADSVSGIANSTIAETRGVTDVAVALRTTRQDATHVEAALAAASRALVPLPGGLAAAAMQLRSLAALIPSITQQCAGITAGLTGVDKHLVNVNQNPFIRLSNVLQLSNVLSSMPNGS